MAHKTRFITKRMWDADYGEHTGAEGDPRNEERSADEIYADEVHAAKFAREMREQRKQPEKS